MRTDNPVVARLLRNGDLESIHRGAWVLLDGSGRVLDRRGDPDQLVFARSAMKSLQALPFVESGAADRFGLDERHLALAIASHSGEPAHLDVARDGLRLIGLDESVLRCGPQAPFGRAGAAEPTRLANNCSGKHVGFLAVARHLGTEPEEYLDPGSPVQQRVRSAVADMTGAEPAMLGTAVDGCSAPTFRLSLRQLALGLGRVASPEQLDDVRAEACHRLTEAAAQHPELVAGSHERFCTDLLRATGGRVFGKIGAEGVYTFGVVGTGLSFAGKADDGNPRPLYPLMLRLLRDHDAIDSTTFEALDQWGSTIRRNWDGVPVGEIDVI